MRRLKSLSLPQLLEPPTLYLWPLLLILVIGVVLWLAIPRPSHHLTIATGSQDGLYFRFGQALAKELAKEKITLEVLPTAGAFENLAKLNNPKPQVDLALVQGGAGSVEEFSNIRALASVFNERVWLFYRSAAFAKTPVSLSALRGKRVSIGSSRSGTHHLARQLFAMHDMPTDASAQAVKISDSDARQSLDSLKNGGLDAVFLVLAPGAPILNEYLQTPGVSVMNFEQAEAYSLRLSFLKADVMPQGAMDLGRDLPKTSLKLMSVPATLITHSEIHPALITPLMRATEAALHRITLLEKPGEFPSGLGFDWPLHPDADHYLSAGPSFLHRHLPFWSVVWVERFIRIILPLLIALLPLVRLLPSLIQYRVNSKIGTLYRRLQMLEKKWATDASLPWEKDLSAIREQALKIRVPKRYMGSVYELRMHIDLVNKKMGG